MINAVALMRTICSRKYCRSSIGIARRMEAGAPLPLAAGRAHLKSSSGWLTS
jgi:hypothetical protein